MSSLLTDKKKGAIVFEGAQDFRLRIVLSTLSGQAIEIKGIHPNDSSVGIRGMYYFCSVTFRSRDQRDIWFNMF